MSNQIVIPKYNDLLNEMSMWWRCAGEKARAQFMEELSARTHLPGSAPGLRSVYSKLNMDFSVDFSDDVYSLGDHFVYAWVTKKGQLFYIGCGDLSRCCNFTSRDINFKTTYQVNDCKPYILCANIDKDLAFELETLCIWVTRVKGFRLHNKSKQLCEAEVNYFAKRKSNLPVDNSLKYERKYQRYVELIEQYPDVVVALKRLLSHCLDLCLSETNDPIHGEWTPIAPTLSKNAVSHVWTIDGVVQSASEWCKHYGTPLSVALNRIKKYGMTPKEALIAPPIPKCYKRCASKYYASVNFVPGSDTTSIVTPLEQWPPEYILRNT